MKGNCPARTPAGMQEIHPARILALCRTKHLSRRIVLFDEVGSTNTAALSSAAAGAKGETLFIAEEQRFGKGRKGRRWLSLRGKSLTFSLLLSPARAAEGLTAIMALAVIVALENFVKGLAIKWPNDIYLKGRKLGGILAESRDEHVALGLGLNVNQTVKEFPPEIADEAISMRIASRNGFDRGIVLCRLLEEFERLYGRFQEEGFAPFRGEIERCLLYRGEVVVIDSGGTPLEGTMVGITNEGFLRLDIDGSERTFSSGDLTLREKPQCI